MNYFTTPRYNEYEPPLGYQPDPNLQFSPYADFSPPLKPEPNAYATNYGYGNAGQQPELQQPFLGAWRPPVHDWRAHPAAQYAFTGDHGSLSKTGGRRPIIVLVSSLIICGAGLFSIIAQNVRIVFAQSVFNSRYINASSVSAILTISGTVLAAGYMNLLGLIGRMWLWKRFEKKKKIKLGHVMVIASKGAIDELTYAFPIGSASFLIALALVWIIPPAISGALMPTWGRQTDFVPAVRQYFYVAGSGGNATLPELVDCFDRSATARCPARQYYADHHMSMQYSLGGYQTYYQSEGSFQNSTPPTSLHQEIAESWEGVGKHRIDTDRNLVTATSCVPVINSTVSCAITANPAGLTISGGRISYPTVCGQIQIGDANDSPGGGYVNTCQNPGTDNSTITMYYTIVLASGSSSVQVKCDVDLIEQYRWLTYYNAPLWYQDQGKCAGGRIDSLSYVESIPFVSSVAYVLAGSSASASSTQSGGDNPLYSFMQAWMLTNTAESVRKIQLMVRSGISTASTIIYSMGYRNNNGTVSGRNMAPLDAWVVYNAYTWSDGFKGYIWAAFLLVAASCGLAGSIAAFFVPRLRYDPGSYAETMFLIRNQRPQGDTSIAFQPLPEHYADLPLTIDR